MLFTSVAINGGDNRKLLYTVLNVRFPKLKLVKCYLQFRHMGIASSGGSACSSGSNLGSHVLRAIVLIWSSFIAFSFSKYNTIEEIITL